MSSIPWDSDSFAPDYINIGNIKYERKFIDVETMNDGFQQIPFDFNTTHFGVLYEKENDYIQNAAIHRNEECSSGSFFVPFLHYQTKEELILRISKFVIALGGEMKEDFPHVRVFVYRYKDVTGNRFFAIGGINLKPKHDTIHKLGIKTMLREPISPCAKESWNTLIDELENDPKEVSCCQIEKNELLGFESRSVFICKESKDVLVMLSKESGFAAQHFSISNEYSPKTTSNKIRIGTYSQDFVNDGRTFKLKTIRLSSEEDINSCLRWMIESFRKITGASCVFAQVFYYTNICGSVDASMVCSRPVKEENEEDEE